ncbi:MAG: hypothetical protein AAF675_00840 [Pseudomonadota bacterium]
MTRHATIALFFLAAAAPAAAASGSVLVINPATFPSPAQMSCYEIENTLARIDASGYRAPTQTTGAITRHPVFAFENALGAERFRRCRVTAPSGEAFRTR